MGERLADHLPGIMITARRFPLSTTAICIALLSCDSLQDREREGEFIASLQTAIHREERVYGLDLAKTTAFHWTVLHVFVPYTFDHVVDEMIGAPINTRAIDIRDDINLFVFSHDDRPVLAVSVPRAVCNFEPPPDHLPSYAFEVAAEAARFEIRIDDAGRCLATPINPIPLQPSGTFDS